MTERTGKLELITTSTDHCFYRTRVEVIVELKGMKEIGMRVPEGAFALASSLEWIADFEACGISEIADMAIEEASIK